MWEFSRFFWSSRLVQSEGRQLSRFLALEDSLSSRPMGLALNQVPSLDLRPNDSKILGSFMRLLVGRSGHFQPGVES